MPSLHKSNFGYSQNKVIVNRGMQLYPFPLASEEGNQLIERILVVKRSYLSLVKVFPERGSIILSTGKMKDIKYRNVINWFFQEIGIPIEIILGKDGELYLENGKTKNKTKFVDGMAVFMSAKQLSNLITKTGNTITL